MKELFSGKTVFEFDRSEKQYVLWENYGKRRIYIKRDDGGKTYGFIDLNNDNEIVCDTACNVKHAEAFLQAYCLTEEEYNAQNGAEAVEIKTIKAPATKAEREKAWTLMKLDEEISKWNLRLEMESPEFESADDAIMYTEAIRKYTRYRELVEKYNDAKVWEHFGGNFYYNAYDCFIYSGLEPEEAFAIGLREAEAHRRLHRY